MLTDEEFRDPKGEAARLIRRSTLIVVEWWQVDVVLRRASGTDADGEVVLNHLRDALAAMEEPDDHRAFRGVRSTYSYDVAPPEGSVGTSF